MPKQTYNGPFLWLVALALFGAAPPSAWAYPAICVAPEDVQSTWTLEFGAFPNSDATACAKACKKWGATCKKAVQASKTCHKKNFAANKAVDLAGCALHPTKEQRDLCKASVRNDLRADLEWLKGQVKTELSDCRDPFVLELCALECVGP